MKPEQIRRLRKQLGLSQRQFARRLGVSPRTLNRWEMGQAKPSLMHLARLQDLADRGNGLGAALLTTSGHAPSGEACEVMPRLDFQGDANALRAPEVEPYDLVVFDGAHKLSANRDPSGTFRATGRDRLAEAMAGVGELPEEWRRL